MKSKKIKWCQTCAYSISWLTSSSLLMMMRDMSYNEKEITFIWHLLRSTGMWCGCSSGYFYTDAESVWVFMIPAVGGVGRFISRRNNWELEALPPPCFQWDGVSAGGILVACRLLNSNSTRRMLWRVCGGVTPASVCMHCCVCVCVYISLVYGPMLSGDVHTLVNVARVSPYRKHVWCLVAADRNIQRNADWSYRSLTSSKLLIGCVHRTRLWYIFVPGVCIECMQFHNQNIFHQNTSYRRLVATFLTFNFNDTNSQTKLIPWGCY